MAKPLIITIDGPAGAGKPTVSRLLADRLGYQYIDTGALYRGIALEAQEQGVGPDDAAALDALCASVDLRFLDNGEGLRIISKSRDISSLIRTPEITMLASALSAKPVVRECLLGLQRRLGEGGGVVFEGRDMGTVVFPNADIKFFLVASVKTRALRRYREMAAASNQTLEAVERDIRKRDENDSSRQMAPLKPAEDAIKIDSTALPVEAVVDTMITHVEQRLSEN